MSDNPERLHFLLPMQPYLWSGCNMKFFLLCMTVEFTKCSQKISTHLLTVLTISVILHVEQRKRNKKKSSESGVENVDNTQERSESA